MSTAQPTVTRVRGETIHKHTLARKAAGLPPIAAGYRYIAMLSDGTEEVIRARAPRRYEWVYQYARPVTSGKGGLGAYFELRSSRARLGLAEFRVEWI